jgi:hypothetical protein
VVSTGEPLLPTQVDSVSIAVQIVEEPVHGPASMNLGPSPPPSVFVLPGMNAQAPTIAVATTEI